MLEEHLALQRFAMPAYIVVAAHAHATCAFGVIVGRTGNSGAKRAECNFWFKKDI